MGETFENIEIKVGRSYTFYYLLREASRVEGGRQVPGRALGELRGVCKVESISDHSFIVKIDKMKTNGTGCYNGNLPEDLYLQPKYFLKEV